MLDSDLVKLYGVETKIFNRAVKRNIDRFPEDFMFQLTNQELAILKYQIGTSSSNDWGGRRKLPYGPIPLAPIRIINLSANFEPLKH